MVVTAAERAEFASWIRPTLEAAVAEIGRIPDPGMREAAAGALLPPPLLEGPDELLAEALDVVADAPYGEELLAGMAVAAPTRIAVGARVRLESVQDPASSLGALRVTKAWEMEAGEPVSGLFACCAREGARGSQLFSFTIEHPLSGGAIKDGFVTGTTEGARLTRKMTSAIPEGVELRTLEPAEAAERIVAAALQGARSGLSPVEDGLVAAAIFLRASEAADADAIVQALELGEPLAERVEELEEEAFAAAVDDFVADAEAWLSTQAYADERVQAGAFAAGLMADFRVHYLQDEPERWTASDLDAFMLDWMPRKVSLAADEVASFPTAVTDVLRFLAASERLPEKSADALAAWAAQHATRFADAMADPSLHGPAKAIFGAMTAEGVETGDPEAMQAWIEEFNARPQEERERVLGPSPVRASGQARGRKVKARKQQRQARRRGRKR